MNSILIAPHDDDFTLFAALTCMREKPLIVLVTDAYIQYNRGEIGCDKETRAKETLESAKILGCSVVRLGIRDDICNEPAIIEKLRNFQGFDRVYAPALQGGNKDHDMVSNAAKAVFGALVTYYTTYTPSQLYTTGTQEIVGTPEEIELKNSALQCFQSQINLPATKPHFRAIAGKPEWYI